MSRSRGVRQIAVEAYVYLYPLVMMDVTRRQMTNTEAGERVGFGPMNAFTHMRAFPPPEFKAVPWANLDTLYSLAWLDLRDEPLILSTPDTTGRYYLLPIQDMWTDVFAVPGKRTSGTEAGHFAVVPLGWQGELPSQVRRIRRDHPDGVDHRPHPDQRCRRLRGRPRRAERIHDHAAVTVGSAGTAGHGHDRPDRRHDDHAGRTGQSDARGSVLHVCGRVDEGPPSRMPTDWSIRARMQRIGLEPGKTFDTNSAGATTRQVLDQASRRPRWS